MKIPVIIRFALVVLASVCSSSAQQTLFTYQGRLSQGTNPANGSYDLKFTLYDAASVGNALGTRRVPPRHVAVSYTQLRH